MSNIQAGYGTSNQLITITLAGLASTSARQSLAIDNSTTLHIDALVTAKIKTGASGVLATGRVDVYAVGTTDGGTTWTDGANGTDASIALTAPPNAKLLGSINAVAVATTYIGTFNVAQAFNGQLPQKWALVFVNNTGAALDATGTNFAVQYQGLYGQLV